MKDYMSAVKTIFHRHTKSLLNKTNIANTNLLEETENIINLDDIKIINNSYISYIANLDINDIKKRVEEISISDIENPAALNNAENILKNRGIVIIPGLVDSVTCDRVASKIRELYNEYSFHDESFYEDERVIFQRGHAKIKGYYKLSNYSKTIINFREGQDQGMIDIFNCDLALPVDTNQIREVFQSELVLKLLSTTLVSPKNLNIYINKGIVNTRGFHVDSYAKQIKAYIYLTDVNNLNDGPYTYVKNSHIDTPFRRANQQLCSKIIPNTEAPIIDPLAITPVIAHKGSLIISDQSGVHRGWPQSESGARIIAVMNYK